MCCGRPYPKVPDGLFRVNFDLDGTLADSVWPSPHIGALLLDGRRMLEHYADEGFELVIYTSRPESHRARIERWLRQNDLDHLVYDIVCNKPLGLLIDDRSANPLRWRMIER